MPKTLESYIKQDMALPTSKQQMKKYLKKPLNFIDYEKIHADTSIDTLLGKANAVCILWSSKDAKIGHFTLLARRPGGKLLWFDPTGLSIHRLAQVTHNKFVLQKKLEKLGNVTYNRFKYQQIRHDVQSCARHVACRLNMLHMSDEQYRGVMTHRSLSTDDISVLLTLQEDLSHWKG
jgi:hypothetical protein